MNEQQIDWQQVPQGPNNMLGGLAEQDATNTAYRQEALRQGCVLAETLRNFTPEEQRLIIEVALMRLGQNAKELFLS